MRGLRRPARMALQALAVAFVLSACAEAPRQQASPAPLGPEDYPPNDYRELAAIFEEDLGKLGVRLTRGALVDLGNNYERSDTGTHLALYVEPIDEDSYPENRYLDNIAPLTAVFAPSIFERWGALESFDVCQEPFPSVDDRRTPPAVTQVTLTRETAMGIDWERFDLPELLLYRLRGIPDIGLTIAFELTDNRRYEAAWREARKRNGE